MPSRHAPPTLAFPTSQGHVPPPETTADWSAEPRTPGRLAQHTTEDRADVERMARGEGEALAALYDRHAPFVLGLARRILGEAGEAEEVVQETFLQAWREAFRYDAERCTVRGWLLLVARSRALDRKRAATSRRRRETVVARQADAGATAPASRRLELDERIRLVRGALRLLPEEQGHAVQLAFFEGLTHRQIAERLGAPLGTVKSRVLLGMRRLRRPLAHLAG